MSQVRVFLIRHGETDHNVKGIIQGTLDTELNEVGIQQAQWTGHVLAKEGVRFEQAYTSDLKRASKTAEIIVGQGPSACPVTPDARIRERHLGGLQGIRRPKDYNEVALGCEPYHDLLGRCLAFWDALFPSSRSTPSILPPSLLDPRTSPTRKDVYPSILIVSHGASLHTLVESGLLRERGIMVREGVKVPKPRLRHGNCSITEVVMIDTGKEGRRRWKGEFQLLADDKHLYADIDEAANGMANTKLADDLSTPEPEKAKEAPEEKATEGQQDSQKH